MAIQNIIFDLDGTLIDSARLTGLIIDQMLADRGVADVADREMDAVGDEAMIAAVMGIHSQDPAADLEEFRARYRRIEVPGNLAFPGIVDGLAAIRRSRRALAICSNKPQYLCEKILCDLKVDHRFAAIVGSDPVRPGKPAPDAALLALGGTADDTLYCGDSLVDVLTARAAGLPVALPVALVEWGYGSAEASSFEPGLPLVRTMSCLVGILHDESGLGLLLHG
ncbi:MAG: HAD family hydrolase [Erythrobacter sp.]|jgi:phosphoglycolate phosphatase